jgi:Domain of unknown function (DUF4823)
VSQTQLKRGIRPFGHPRQEFEMKSFLIVCVLLTVSACVSTYDVDRPDQVSKRLNASTSAYVTVPPDGHYGQTLYKGSGAKAANAVAAAFRPYLRQVTEAKEPMTLEMALADAREAKADYLIAPSILHWEDRATLWSGRSDRVRIELCVIEVSTGDVVEKATIKGTSGFAAFWVRRRPEQLLPAPLKEYVASLFPQRS